MISPVNARHCSSPTCKIIDRAKGLFAKSEAAPQVRYDHLQRLFVPFSRLAPGGLFQAMRTLETKHDIP